MSTYAPILSTLLWWTLWTANESVTVGGLPETTTALERFPTIQADSAPEVSYGIDFVILIPRDDQSRCFITQNFERQKIYIFSKEGEEVTQHLNQPVLK